MSYGRLQLKFRDLNLCFIKLEQFDFQKIGNLNYIGIINLINEEVYLPNWTFDHSHIETEKLLKSREQALTNLFENESLKTSIFPIKWLVFYTRYNQADDKKCWEMNYYHKITSSFCHKVSWWLDAFIKKIEANSRNHPFQVEHLKPCAPTHCKKEFKLFAKPVVKLHFPEAIANLILEYSENDKDEIQGPSAVMMKMN